MNRYNYIGDTYLIELLVKKTGNQFDIHDENYIDGTTGKKPLDFNLHLALHLLEKEYLPLELLEPLEQWARDNKMVEACTTTHKGETNYEGR